MKILGVIPARYGSSRFPGKPLADIMGKPMIQRVYEQARECLLLDDLIVATDDERIACCIRSFNGNVMMTPETLNSGTERCNAVVKNFPGAAEFDIVINIQGDEPFINPQQISQLAGCFLSEEVVIGTLVKKITQRDDLINPNVVKVVFDRNYKALYFSRQPIPYSRETEPGEWLSGTNYYKHIGIYGYRTGILNSITQLPVSLLEKAESLEQLRWLENGYPIHVKETDYESIAIDTPGDLLKITNIS
ncbi:MAG TPA: 3-deoxy-manno-octulosonate cytidylyltransferase [Bacteroidales bacterium]|nr:3-deoxy-manno-octulosonate cytidylyltransferase [Bacteroidales bacterium]